MKILVVEDDRDIAELIEYNLRQEKYATEVVTTGTQAVNRALRTQPDVIILDLMLPEMDGLEVCRILKSDQRTKHIPVLMLTAKGSEVDRIVGFEVGAEDYLTKPFSPRELALRIKAIVRRVKASDVKEEKPTLSFGTIRVDPSRFQVTVGKEEIKLTAIEFKLLHYLITTKGRVASRDSLLDHVWGYDSILTTRTVDTHVKRLRAKMGRAGKYVETIRGVGYRFREKPEGG
jgi:two-component system phosphate regulon response regulator PhoB